MDWAVAVAKRRSPAVDISIFDFIREVLLLQAAEGKPEAYREAVVALAMKFQQYTAPVMAKGLEDKSHCPDHPSFTGALLFGLPDSLSTPRPHAVAASIHRLVSKARSHFLRRIGLRQACYLGGEIFGQVYLAP